MAILDMGFQISGHGSREGVINNCIVPAKAGPGEKADQTQIEAVKALLISEIGALPADFNGVQVEAQGEAHPGARTMQITIIPKKLHL
jgi:hypothetical protein